MFKEAVSLPRSLSEDFFSPLSLSDIGLIKQFVFVTGLLKWVRPYSKTQVTTKFQFEKGALFYRLDVGNPRDTLIPETITHIYYNIIYVPDMGPGR